MSAVSMSSFLTGFPIFFNGKGPLYYYANDVAWYVIIWNIKYIYSNRSFNLIFYIYTYIYILQTHNASNAVQQFKEQLFATEYKWQK